jgi:hypothetical protein
MHRPRSITVIGVIGFLWGLSGTIGGVGGLLILILTRPKIMALYKQEEEE